MLGDRFADGQIRPLGRRSQAELQGQGPRTITSGAFSPVKRVSTLEPSKAAR